MGLPDEYSATAIDFGRPTAGPTIDIAAEVTPSSVEVTEDSAEVTTEVADVNTDDDGDLEVTEEARRKVGA